jgi:transposase
MTHLTVGIDISKAKFDAAILFVDNKVKTKKFTNNQSGFLEFMEWLKRHEAENAHICLEATGVYGHALTQALFEANHAVSVVNPAQTKGFAQSELTRTKTDKADSQVIARFCRAISPPLWKPKPAHVEELQAWVRRLEGLQDLYRQEINRLDVAPVYTQSSIKTVVEKLKEELTKAKKKIKEHIKGHPDLRDKQRLLETIPGIGEATIAQILSFMSNIEDFKNARQLAAFVGLNPKQRQSGSSIHGRTRLSKVGDSRLRKAFYLPAVVAKQHNPVIKAFCERLKGAGKPTMLIIGAEMRKLVHIIYGVLKSGKAFDINLAIG